MDFADGRGVLGDELRWFDRIGLLVFFCVGMFLVIKYPGRLPRVEADEPLRLSQDGAFLVVPAEVIRVVDGDTVDLRFRIWTDTIREDRVRLLGIDTPELRGPERAQGIAASDYLASRLNSDQVYLKTDGRKDKYGRLLGILLLAGANGMTDLNQELLTKGLARSWR